MTQPIVQSAVLSRLRLMPLLRPGIAVATGLGLAAALGLATGPSNAKSRPSARPATAAVVPLPTPFVPPEAAGASPKGAKPAVAVDPDRWTASEIDDAQRICREALKSIHAVVEPLAPIKHDQCGAPGPVRLLSIGRRNPVMFEPAPTINCAMLAPLKRWLDTSLQPLAATHFETRVTHLHVLSSYSCRTRYGRKEARMSEHAFANALDIGSFRLANKTEVDVLKHWGATRRDIAQALAERQEAERRAALAKLQSPPNQSKAGDKVSATGKAQTGSQGPPVTPARPTLPLPAASAAEKSDEPPLPVRRPLRHSIRARAAGTPGRRTSSPANLVTYPAAQRLGGPKPDNTMTPGARFLRGAHQGACTIFGTVLGPEANEAHRNHFHVDMHPRRRRNYCE